MNSSFRNSNLGFVLYAMIIFMIVTVLAIITWYMLVGYRSGTYSEDTILGSVYLGGLREEDVDSKINKRVDTWLDDPTIVFELTYQGYSYEFDRNLFYFNVPLSKQILKDGETNELVAEYQSSGNSNDFADTIAEIYGLPFLDGVKDNVDIQEIINDILDDAGLMKTYSSKAVEDYFLDETASYGDLDSVRLSVPEGVNVDDLISGIEAIFGDDSIDLPSKQLFDVVTVLKDQLNDAEMTLVSKGMLELSHATNFSIHEVHYVPRYDSGTYTFETFPFGSNTKVNQTIGDSFSLYNPNDSVYSFRIEKVNQNTIDVVLYGLEFVDTIEVEIVLTQIAYIQQFTDDTELLSPGQDGVVVSVVRTITNIEEEVTFDREIIFEFYPPVSEILLEQVPVNPGD